MQIRVGSVFEQRDSGVGNVIGNLHGSAISGGDFAIRQIVNHFHVCCRRPASFNGVGVATIVKNCIVQHFCTGRLNRDPSIEVRNLVFRCIDEIIANEAARDFCVPKDEMDSFFARKDPFFSTRDILGFARKLGVHPGIVAGQLQYRTGQYNRFRNFQKTIKGHVLPYAIVDGWGEVAPVSL